MKLHFLNFSNCSLWCLDKKTLSIIYDTMNVIYNLPKTKSENVSDWITKSNIGSRNACCTSNFQSIRTQWCTFSLVHFKKKLKKNRRIDRWKNSSLLSSHEIPRDRKSNRNTSTRHSVLPTFQILLQKKNYDFIRLVKDTVMSKLWKI